MQGKIHIYTGDGKGKTTSALGIALRSAGWGMKVLLVQFLKAGWETGEVRFFQNVPEVELLSYGIGRQIKTNDDIDAKTMSECREGFDIALKKMKSGEYEVVILDEVNILIHFGILTVEEVLNFMNEKLENVELILTGRYAPPEIIERADLVSDIISVKHYFSNSNRPAKKGIEY